VTLPRACIIGAGSSGIAAAKALHERGVPFDCFEKSDRIGGNWVFGNRNGMSAAYRDLFINTSRQRMSYADFPMPESYPDFPHHTHIAAYFDDYVDHFGIREKITFQTGVDHAERGEDGAWQVTLDDGRRREYDALLVANGHHWKPRWPEPAFPGADTFAGEQLHAHSYVDNSLFAGRRSVILGMGNSAMDIAVESSYVAERTYLAGRSGVWILPKYVFGKPVDQMRNDPRVPFAIRQRMIQQLVRSYMGPPERYGLPKPEHRFGEAHPTISGRILDRIQHGTITPKPNIESFDGSRVRFVDGSDVDADVVVYCTGYQIAFPFFDEDFISAPDNHIELFRRVFHPVVPNVFFIGLLQPLGAIMPIAEAQGAWVGDYLTGDYRLPDAARVRADIAADQAAMRKRYVASKRHTIQVDFDDYLHALAKERAAGAERARRNGFKPPVECLLSADTVASESAARSAARRCRATRPRGARAAARDGRPHDGPRGPPRGLPARRGGGEQQARGCASAISSARPTTATAPRCCRAFARRQTPPDSPTSWRLPMGACSRSTATRRASASPTSTPSCARSRARTQSRRPGRAFSRPTCVRWRGRSRSPGSGLR
jgi:dimethylaniline monooxygenase (N-oxide forming)